MSAKIVRQCERCGKTFEAYPCEVAKGWGRFCSRRCVKVRSRNRTELLADGSVRIELTAGSFALIDAQDLAIVEMYKWWTNRCPNTNYAATEIRGSNGTRRGLAMHTAIMIPGPGFEVDHVDGNGLNNRRSNLRCVTHRKNMQNWHGHKTSKYPGVYWASRNCYWVAKACVGRSAYQLGYYLSEEAASTAYQKAVAEIENGTFVPPAKKKKKCASRGVCLSPNGKRYIAQKRVNGKIVRIGSFATEEQASNAFAEFEYRLRHAARPDFIEVELG